MSVTQLPMNLSGVGRWYADVERHMNSRAHDSNDQDGCAGCIRLRDRMRELRVKYADKLVTL